MIARCHRPVVSTDSAVPVGDEALCVGAESDVPPTEGLPSAPGTAGEAAADNEARVPALHQHHAWLHSQPALQPLLGGISDRDLRACERPGWHDRGSQEVCGQGDIQVGVP